VSDSVTRVLERLTSIGFETRDEPIAPFGEPLALVAAVAWDATTSQLALIAELEMEQDTETWRQLLFAGSGIRHQLAGDGPAAYGTPVILLIVDEECERRIRELAENLAESYALFNRVEINLIRRSDLDNDPSLDVALAPLLPSCRQMLGQEISRGEVQRFWQTLREEIHNAAFKLDPIFAAHREQASLDCAHQLIGDSEQAPELPAPTPQQHIQLDNFRTFGHAEIDLAAVTVIHGPNGSGKSTIVEALELMWAGRSQRQPDDVGPDEYARHLPGNGDGQFMVTTADRRLTTVTADATTELPRCVLNQEVIAQLVSSSPQDRYLGLLATTGLEIPDLKARTDLLVKAAKSEADAALSAAGLQPLRRADTDARKHLVNTLGASFAARLPADGELAAAEQTLAAVAAGAFAPRNWRSQEANAALSTVDGLVGRVLAEPESPGLNDALDEAQDVLRHLATERQTSAQNMQRLLGVLASDVPSATASQPTPRGDKNSGIPPALAARWLSHARSVIAAAADFRREADALDRKRWSDPLAAYADALQAAAKIVPQEALEPLTRASMPLRERDSPRREQPREMFIDAGFTRVPDQPLAILPALGELANQLQRHAASLNALAGEIAQHPARRFAEHSGRVLGAICRFELARSLRREGPIMRASETRIGELLRDRLAPVVRELVAATVRFEWYFKPLEIPDQTRKLVLGGLATSKPDLDARMTLNSAERHVLGVAWFLALHLLQPVARRRVLVLDDPTAGFDAVNQAGFIATLRAFVRLTRPDQLILVTQDDTLAAVLSEEFAPVDGWPQSATRIRCRRDADDRSTTSVFDCPPAWRDITEESEILGLHGATPAPA
jgi:energy-coupling factor transporter ATP-binding protein EcfA2